MNPAAGVMATRPATAPVTTPSNEGRRYIQLSIIQTKAAVAAQRLVATKALAASPPEVNALPALKPNHPNQSIPAPSATIGILPGSIGSFSLNPLRGPSSIANESADTPAAICTTVPPAKSSAPILFSQPPLPQTQCAIGQYTN